MPTKAADNLPVKPFYTMHEVAELYGVCYHTVLAWAKTGELKTFKRGHFRFAPASEVLAPPAA